MRLILVDNNSGYIFGDTANYLAGSSEWRDDTSGDDRDAERLPVLAARLLDESIGELGRARHSLSLISAITSKGRMRFI